MQIMVGRLRITWYRDSDAWLHRLFLHVVIPGVKVLAAIWLKFFSQQIGSGPLFQVSIL